MIIILATYIFNFIHLYYRKKKWIRNKYKWLILINLAILGVGLLYYQKNNLNTSQSQELNLWALTIPLLFATLDYTFLKFSYLIHNRDFYLWLRGSDDIKSRKHIRASDRLFSIFLLSSIFELPFLILLGK